MARQYSLTPRDVQAINNTAARLGIRPEDLTAVIHYETIGTMNPAIKGGKGGNYQGLIQFGPTERRRYGYDSSASFADQVEGPVYRYLKDRGLQPGDDVGRLYRTINGGNRNAKLWKNDGNGTIAQHIERIKSRSLPAAQGIIRSVPAGPDMGAIMDVANLNAAPPSVPSPPTAMQSFAGLDSSPAQVAISDMLQSPPPGSPPQWAMASGFPIDESLTGRTAQDVLMGGPRPDPRRQLASSPIAPDMGSMRSPADVLNAGPRLRPPVDVPMPTPPRRPDNFVWNGGGAPANPPAPNLSPRSQASIDRLDAAMVPRPRPDNFVWNGGGAPDNPPVPHSNPRRDPYGFPIDVNRPRLNGERQFPAVYGEQPQSFGDLSAAMGGPPVASSSRALPDNVLRTLAGGDGPSTPRPMSIQERAASQGPNAIAGWYQRTYPDSPEAAEQRRLHAEQLARGSMVAGRPDFIGSNEGKSNPAYSDWTRAFDIPGPMTRMQESPAFPDPLPPPGPSFDFAAPGDTFGMPRPTQGASADPGMGFGPYGMTPPPPPPDVIGSNDGRSNPAYSDWTRAFDIPPPNTRMQEFPVFPDALIGGPSFDFAAPGDTFGMPRPTQGASADPGMGFGPYGMTPPPLPPDLSTGNVAPSQMKIPVPGSYDAPSGEGFTYAPPMPAPPATPQALQDQFKLSFSPRGITGQIYDLNPPSASPRSAIDDMLAGPGGSMSALPFNSVQASAQPRVIPGSGGEFWQNQPPSDLGLDADVPSAKGMSGASAMYGSVVGFDPSAKSVVSPELSGAGNAGSTVANPTGGTITPTPDPMEISIGGVRRPPRQANRGAENQRQGIIGRILSSLLGGAGGSILGGFGQQPVVNNWSSPKSVPYGTNGSTQWKSGTSNALGGSTALTWNKSNGQPITVYTPNNSFGQPQTYYTSL